MKIVATALFVTAIAVLLLSCGAQTENTTPEPAAALPQAAEPEAVQETTPVEVSAEGNTFEPAVNKDRVPDGAWFCDMGTVHYARAEEGDGRCATCGMQLVHKGDAEEEPAADAHHDHDH